MSETDTPSSKVIRNDPWYGSYAARAEAMRASEIRALFAVASRPEVVSLAGGMPYLEYMPFKELSELIAKMMVERGDVAWQYGSAQGDPHLREDVLQIMELEGITDAHPDDVVITNGSQNALDLITRIMCDPGDVVLSEAPNYVGALGVFQSFQVEVVNVMLDENGLIPESFEETIVEQRKQGKKVKFLYTVPNFHNPAGVTLSVERRPRILEIARKYHVLIVEDNPYGLLGFDGQTYPALRSMDDQNVVYLSSFSKIIAPGMRIAWMVAPLGIRQKLVLANEASILCPPNMSQFTITTYLDNFDWKKQINDYRGMYKKRCDTMDAALREYLPYCSWHKPKGGFYIWLKIPEGLDSRAMLPRAVTAKVAYVAGTGFYMNGEGRDHMRLSFCYPTPDRIHEGIRRLAGVIDAERETTELFGTSGVPDPDPRDSEHPGPQIP
ncbi:PLP-dependent aminotransferase family protein [Bifidobacterium sp.]|jgi:DNA-binding transcriptional MocR family regulator|uniref:aminotransferase-like domain-containing protein n=1 Tax=Bifidobacterium sp. TaxID=41200 RepID=UPI0025BAB309|nr:PLP-dependent aminotransferase family protein [Bifidobacterium sp.]MCH4209534.1 PLP-dependent aminotransferase family protein [Bifidobacterium sp.]MCI1224818.1 PLP-dependent aminotransferase family protein [Bifidobacterium sp.]